MEKVKLTKIGNSQGFRISKRIMEKAQLKINDEKEVFVNEKNEIVIRSSKKPREGWEEQIRKIGSDNSIGIKDIFEDENFDDWTW